MSGPILAPDHKGMRVDACNMLRTVEDMIQGDRDGSGYVYMIQQFKKHLREMADRYYSGDMAAVDEFCQLYCFDKNRPQSPTPTTQRDGGGKL